MFCKFSIQKQFKFLAQKKVGNTAEKDKIRISRNPNVSVNKVKAGGKSLRESQKVNRLMLELRISEKYKNNIAKKPNRT